MKSPFSPREFLKARRPERFSDTVFTQFKVLDRAQLEYHLETLTSRNQDTEFERFGLELARRTICPNLRPMTGPTGGGDSKADSETFPVAEDLTLGWCIGEPKEAASQRWAFAFSAKEDWRPKVRSDIQKIAKTGRGYKKAFFMSNQFIRDKERGELEDELKKKHKIDVRILDRTWILDQVFNGRLEELAIKELGISTTSRREAKPGPLDVQRQLDMEALEESVRISIQSSQLNIQFVGECIEIAELARGLDRPRFEVDGLFKRAERAAKEYGTKFQLLEATYQRAWTAYWWHEDYKEFSEIYSEVETLAVGSDNPFALERLNNLWFVLYSVEKFGTIDRKALALDSRTVTLAQNLERLSRQEHLPTAALQARSMLLIQHLGVTMPNPPESVITGLKKVIEESRGMIGFPLEPLATMIIEMGDFLSDLESYDELCDLVVEVMGTEAGEIASARLLVDRGLQRLQRDKYYDAIDYIGRALFLFAKNETRHELIHALVACSYVNERIGLLWAARSTLLNAAAHAISEFDSFSEISSLRLVPFRYFKWIELMLGRFPQILSWHAFDLGLRQALSPNGELTLREEDSVFDLTLGLLILKTSLGDLRTLEAFPDVLENLGLIGSRLALLFALGHVEEQDLSYLLGEEEDDLEAFFLKWLDQPAAKELPDTPALNLESTVALTSKLLGCEIRVVSENVSPCIEIGETFLATIESLMATAMKERVIAVEPLVKIKIGRDAAANFPFEFAVDSVGGVFNFGVRCPDFSSEKLSRDRQEALSHGFLDLAIHVLVRVFYIGNHEAMAKTLFIEQGGFARAKAFTGSVMVARNILGEDAKMHLKDWSSGERIRYELKRTSLWFSQLVSKGADQVVPKVVQPAGEETSIGLGSRDQFKHSEITTVSLIRSVLWNAAGWRGIAYLPTYDRSQPTIFALIFGDTGAATAIFQNWKEELGKTDENNRLTILILKGIFRDNPFSYRVVLGTNPTMVSTKTGTGYINMIARIHQMTPTNSKNLDAFERDFNRFGTFFLGFAVGEDGKQITPNFEYLIKKNHIEIREAWTVRSDELAALGIFAGDDPFIPSDVKDAPVIKVIAQRKESEGRSAQ